MPRPLLVAAPVCLLLALACGGSGDTGKDPSTDGSETGFTPTGDADCESTATDLPQDLKDAIATTCSAAVACGAWTCSACISTFEESSRGQTSYVQATYPESVLCLSTVSCEEWLAEDFSECTGDQCGGIWCGSDSSVCSAKGCGTCQYDGYCGG